MKYLNTKSHQPPPQYIVSDGMTYDSASLIAGAEKGDAKAISILAEAGYVPHQYPDNADDYPLGLRWALDAEGAYIGTPVGSEAERAAELANRALRELRLRWKARDGTVRARGNKDVALDVEQPTDARIRALHNLLTGEDNG